MSNVDDSELYRGGNLKALRAWDALRITLSRKLPGRLRDANRLAQRTKLDPTLRKRG